MRLEDSTHHVLINLRGEYMRDPPGDALIAESGVTELHLDDGRDDLLGRAFRASFAPDPGEEEQAPILSIDQRLVES